MSKDVKSVVGESVSLASRLRFKPVDLTDVDMDDLKFAPRNSGMTTFVVGSPGRRRTLMYNGKDYPTWHNTMWDGPALMLVVAPRGSGATQFIATIEDHLDKENSSMGSSVPKLVCPDATKLTADQISFVCASYGNKTRTEDKGGWNVVLRFYNLSDVPAFWISAARYVVFHQSFWSQTVPPILPLAPAPAASAAPATAQDAAKDDQGKSPQWQLDAKTNQWVKRDEKAILDMGWSHHQQQQQQQQNCSIPFCVADRETSTVFLDVTSCK